MEKEAKKKLSQNVSFFNNVFWEMENLSRNIVSFSNLSIALSDLFLLAIGKENVKFKSSRSDAFFFRLIIDLQFCFFLSFESLNPIVLFNFCDIFIFSSSIFNIID